MICIFINWTADLEGRRALSSGWFHALPVLRDVCATAYQALPLMLIVVIAVQLKQRESFPIFPVMVFGLAGLEAPLLYRVVPAVGSEYVFGPNFAYGPHWMSGLAIVTPMHAAPANSMPSLHFAWALLALWNMPRNNRGAVFGAAVFALVIALATLGLGEHYAIDLVVAVPFAVCVQSTCMGRWRAAILCGAITLGWLCYLRFLLPHFEPQPLLLWATTSITILVPCRAVRRRDVPAPEPVSEENFICAQAAV